MLGDALGQNKLPRQGPRFPIADYDFDDLVNELFYKRIFLKIIHEVGKCSMCLCIPEVVWYGDMIRYINGDQI